MLIQFGSPIPQPTPGPVTHTNQESIDGRYIGMPMPKGVAGLVDQMQFGVVGGFGG